MRDPGRRSRVLILGAAGRDFHNFNVVYRSDPSVEVVAFTAAQIPGIEERRYPPELSGSAYPLGIPIRPEAELETLIDAHAVEQVVFAYSDVRHVEVMRLGSRALAAGADFVLLGPRRTMLCAAVPVVAVSAVRTGCGKSQVARYIAGRMRASGIQVAVVRHPMPYGKLEAGVQRFATGSDLDAAGCTVEEREEYEPHLAAGNVVFAGVAYTAILARAQTEADVIVWDGGNNDFPFVRPDLHIVLVDCLRPGHETGYHPGEAVLRMADVVVLAKSDAAPLAQVTRLIEGVRKVHAGAQLVRGASPITLDDVAAVRGRRVLAVEDGPTITHGGMPHGAAYVAALEGGAAAIVDPRPWAAPEIAAIYARHLHIGVVLPALGYSGSQIAALAATINAADADVVVAGTPVDLARLMTINKPVVRARYDFAELEQPGLWDAVECFLATRVRKPP